MQKAVAQKLKEAAEKCAQNFSNNDRSRNFNNETFKVDMIEPLSEHTAVVIFKKNTGKVAAFFFYYLNMGDGYWRYFCPSDSHILGMESFKKYKDKAEKANWVHN